MGRKEAGSVGFFEFNFADIGNERMLQIGC
jgi:hypothetical protein